MYKYQKEYKVRAMSDGMRRSYKWPSLQKGCQSLLQNVFEDVDTAEGDFRYKFTSEVQ